MPINDKAVLTAATGFIFTAPVGTAAPTPVEVAALATPKLLLEAGIEDVVVDPDADADAGGKAGGRSAVVADAKTTLPVAWVNVGHTSRGDLPEFGYDGGDLEVRGTWQNESLREVETDPVQDYLTFKLHQFDNGALELYYGKDGLATTTGVFGVPGGSTVPVEKALFILIIDGTNKVGFHAHKASFRRDDAIEMATDEFAALPVKATFLKHNSEVKFSWINKDLFVP
jgi:hypothetical protein